MLGEIAVARYFLKRKLYCYETSLKITCLKLTMQDCLAEFPTKVTARATNPPPYSITRLFVPCTSFRFYYSFFFLQPEKCKPLRIPRVYISKRKQQSKHSRLQMRLHLFFKFTTNN